MIHKLDNYLRMHRKKAGFTQREIAFLLGCQSGAKVSRYEQLKREPGLWTAFMYEALFKVPTRELFAGIYEKAEKAAVRRTRLLLRKLGAQPSTPTLHPKLQTLKAICQ